MPEAYTRKGIEMTKKEKELEHDRATYQMMSRVNRHAEVQQIVDSQESQESWQIAFYIMAFATGCLCTTALMMALNIVR